MDPYRKYFNIDPEYFPAVNSEVIKKKPDLWKKFYPHETFIKLLKDTIAVLERKQKLNIWVEGAYGTGKSHAVLTLKHLLDAPEVDVRDYFNNFKLDKDLLYKFLKAKDGDVLTVHRYGSSSIQSDNDLVLAIQESIEDALNDKGIRNAGPNAMREGVIKYLEDETNKAIVKTLVEGPYKVLFGNRTIDNIIEDLKKFNGQDLHELMDKLAKISNERQIKIFSMDIKGLNKWITETISANGLKQIVFIWDEFSEYFYNNVHRLTGFQEMLELSASQPYCFIQVTHQSKAIVRDSPKLLDRYIQPLCRIELPDNTAFDLMGAAMQVSKDPVIKSEWTNEIIPDLEERTPDSRKVISKAAKIGQKELAKILPIHPYAASLLKYISEGYASNQRSMFDFIKNSNNDEEYFGFQWFIDNHSPLDPEPFLCIDMLWGFFYEKGKEFLTQSVRRTLDIYQQKSRNLSESDQRILKAILLFQAMSEGVASGVEAFLPTQKNLKLAYEGTDLDHEVVSIAERLVKQKILYKKPEKDGTFLYSVHSSGWDISEIEKYKNEFVGKPTSDLIADGGLSESISVFPELKGRLKISFAGSSNLDNRLNEARNRSENDNRHIYVVVTFAKDSTEGGVINKKVKAFYAANKDADVVVVDTSRTPLGKDELEKWVENKSIAKSFSGKDNVQAQTYSNYALGVLRNWRQRVGNGNFVLFTKDVQTGRNVNNMDTLNEEFKEIDRRIYPLAPEVNWNLNDTMWSGQGTPLAVELGITQELKSSFKTNQKNRSIETNLGAAWKNDQYWVKYPALPVSRIKIALEELIHQHLEEDGRISIGEIYDFLKEPPYGFLPNNFLAFLLGFLLKEYTTGEYTWSDNNISDNMDVSKMKETIVEIIKRDVNPVGHYRDKYIVSMTPEEKAFLDGTSKAFGISRSFCSTIESARDKVRLSMKKFTFPLWTLEYILASSNLKTDRDLLTKLIHLYCEFANNGGVRTETSIAMEIGQVFVKSPHAVDDLRDLLTDKRTREGMQAYLDTYQDGVLPSLGREIDDQGQYLNVLARKYDADASMWVWKRETTDQRIDEVILEYKIAATTQKLLGMACRSYRNAMSEWAKKAENIRLPFPVLKTEVPAITPLLSLLVEYHKNDKLTEQQKESFLKAMNEEGKAFNAFYLNQESVFRQGCAFYLNDLEDKEKSVIFIQMPSSFYNDEGSYYTLLENKVSTFKKQKGLTKLRDCWKSKSGFDSPREWSRHYRMPIILMVPEKDSEQWQVVFDTLNMPSPNEKQVDYAMSVLESATIWNELADEDLRNISFVKQILKDDAVVLDNVEEVKDELMHRLSSDPYKWLGMPALQSTIANLVKDKYVKGRYTLAMEVIDEMDPETVKTYLKGLIKNNPIVGIQIIKNK